MLKKVNGWFNRQSSVIQIIILLSFVFMVRTVGFGLYQVPTGSMENTMLVGERFFADKFTPIFGQLKRGDIVSFNAPNYPYSDNTIISIWQRYVWGPQNWTKRIVGLPGEHIKGIIEDGKPTIYINEKKFDESYINTYPLIGVWNAKPGSSFRKKIEQGVSYKTYDPSKPFDKQPFYKINPLKIVNVDHPALPKFKHPGVPMAGGEDIFDVHLGNNQYWVMGDNRLGSHDSRGWGPLDGKLIHGKLKYRIWSIDSSYSWLLLDLLLHPIGFWSKTRWSRCLNILR